MYVCIDVCMYVLMYVYGYYYYQHQQHYYCCCFIIIFFILIYYLCYFILNNRRKDKKKYLKSAQSQASEPPPFMGMMEPVPYLAHKSHHLNPLYNNNEAMDFYDPVGTSMFDRPYNAMSREEYQFTEAPQSSVYRPIVGSSSSQRRGTYHE